MDIKTKRSVIKVCLLIGIICGCICSRINASDNDYYSSIPGLESLLKTEEILLEDLRSYVETTRSSLQLLEHEISLIANEHQLASPDVDTYLTNPINSYKLIKRLHNDWQIYRQLITTSSGYIQQMDEHFKHSNYPNEDDLLQSALALTRLQSTYNLDVAQLASGILNGIKYGNEMSWSDCLFLGQQLIRAKSYNHTKLWIKESARRYNFESVKANETPLDILVLFVTHLLKIGDSQTAMNVFQSIIRRYPERLHDLEDIYDNTRALPDNYEEERHYHTSNEFKLYEKVCRQEITRTPTEERDLRCRYQAAPNCLYCRLAPFKMEELNFDPFIVIFHNMMSDEGIEQIKAAASPIMERSMVRGPTPTEFQKSNYRISKNAWLQYEYHPHAMKLLLNLQDVTGLDMRYSEQLQVANYGLGGQYEPHFDFNPKVSPGEVSNRISTSIVYLSDVEQGGATAFPFLKIAVKPTKGNVLFWYNLHRSLDGDYRTKHAGCPVLKGSKWIANVWTHDIHQDKNRPCALHRDHESSLGYEFVN